MSSIGKLKTLVDPEIRKIWPTEEGHLSPWIAENVDTLNEALNLQIEIEAREEYIHGFRLDLAGTDAASQMPVIIENQFGKSDHDHLGKLITYSAAKEAGIVVWIANEIQFAHSQAIDWLNSISPDEMSFYGVELEVFQIDDSLPAANFRVVAGPPPGKRPPPVSGEISPRNERYRQFFDRLLARLLSVDPGFTRAKAPPQSWWNLGIGRSGFSVMLWFRIEAKFRVAVYIDTGSKEANDAAFAQLSENKALIEDRLGQELAFEPLPDRRACAIYAAVDGTIDDDEATLTDLIAWAVPLMIKFREVFGPLVRNLELES